MRVYHKRTSQPYCIYLYREEAERLLDPNDWFVIGRIREQLDGLIHGNQQGEAGTEEPGHRG